MSSAARLKELRRDLEHLRSDQQARRGAPGRGREADHPGEIPPRGWKDVLWRAWGEVSDQNLFLIAGGVTYAILLALFPGLAALVSLYGLVFDTAPDREAGGGAVGHLAGTDPGTAEPAAAQSG